MQAIRPRVGCPTCDSDGDAHDVHGDDAREDLQDPIQVARVRRQVFQFDHERPQTGVSAEVDQPTWICVSPNI